MSIALRLLSTWLSRSSIHFDDSRCINNRNKLVNCTKCLDICPSPKALEIKNQKIIFDVNHCSECKKCTFTCQSAVFKDKELFQRLENIKYQKSVIFSCEKIDREKNSIALTCLFQLKLPHILYAAVQDKKVKIHFDKELCFSCQDFNENIIDHLKTLIQDGNSILNQVGLGKEICVIDEQDQSVDEMVFSRADFFKYLATNTTKASSEFLPDWVKETSVKDKLNRNEENILLEYSLKKLFMGIDDSNKNILIDTRSIGIAKVQINDHCNGCGICVAHCPTDSLLIENTNKILLSQKITNCMDCLACQKTCPKGAIELEYNILISELLKDKIDLFEKQLMLCRNCGEPTHNEICDECQRKQRLEEDMFQFFS